MRIIVDAMSGDNAPEAVVRGALDAKREFAVDICLVGRESMIKACMDDGETADIVGAEDVIGMDDDPATAVRRKPNSSMTVALKLLESGGGDAVVSAGNTGALLTGATLLVKRVPGVRRAALAPVLPNGGRGVCVIDSGANTECTPEYLLQFACMASYYANKVMNIKAPRVGLLNIGTEETKGTDLQKEAFVLLKQAHSDGKIVFIGNVEGTGVLNGEVDVVVTDGYTGNVLLKSIEGTVQFLLGAFKKIVTAKPEAELKASMTDLMALKSVIDAAETGGTALLGISKPVIKAHGSSDARAIRSAVMQAINVADSDILSGIAELIK